MTAPLHSLEAQLEDFVWGRVREGEYLQKVAKSDIDTAESILSRVRLIDTDLNKQLRKGVEENLSRLLEQTTALEGLERRQKNVHAQMEYVKEGCDRIAKSLAAQAAEYKEGVEVADRIFTARNLLSDAMRCEELMEQFAKRNELVKRSEIICEMRGIIKDSPELREIAWLRPTINDKLKKAVTEVHTTASSELRRGLETLNASTVSAAKRALSNLALLDGELEQVLTRSVATLDAALLQLTATTANTSATLLPAAINGIQAHLEQASLLGEQPLAKFADRLARTMRARVPVDAPYALRFVQSISRVLQSRPSSAALTPLQDALRPLKHALLSQSLARLHEVIGQHDLATAAPHSSRFVEVLNAAMEEELRLVEWDAELHAEAAKNLAKCFELVAQKIEAALRLDEASLLLGDRVSPSQQANYRLLHAAHALAAHWPAHAPPLHTLHQEATSLMVGSVRAAISAILASLHREQLGASGREHSAYMQELAAYLSRLALHASHASSSLGRSDILSQIADTTLLSFLVHASLVRPVDATARTQLRADLERLLTSLDELCVPVGLPSYLSRVAEDAVLKQLFKSSAAEILDSLPSSSSSPYPSSCIPPWLLIHFLVADSPAELLSPHDSVQYDRQQYVGWVLQQADQERLQLLSGLLDAYAASVVKKGGTEYVSNYARIVGLLETARQRNAPKA